MDQLVTVDFIDKSRWRIEEVAFACRDRTGTVAQRIARHLLRRGIESKRGNAQLFLFHDAVKACVLADLIRAGVPAAASSWAAKSFNLRTMPPRGAVVCAPLYDEPGRPLVDGRGRIQLWGVAVVGALSEIYDREHDVTMVADDPNSGTIASRQFADDHPLVIFPLANLVKSVADRLRRARELRRADADDY